MAEASPRHPKFVVFCKGIAGTVAIEQGKIHHLRSPDLTCCASNFVKWSKCETPRREKTNPPEILSNYHLAVKISKLIRRCRQGNQFKAPLSGIGCDLYARVAVRDPLSQHRRISFMHHDAKLLREGRGTMKDAPTKDRILKELERIKGPDGESNVVALGLVSEIVVMVHK
jgi:hypothetical protein